MSKRVGGPKRRQRIEQLAERDGWSCRYCDVGLALGAAPTTIDEWVPICRGGLARVENQVLACSPCNQDKKDMTGDEYLAKLAGHVSLSYYEHRVGQKRQQRQAALASPPPPRRQRLRHDAYLMLALAEIWPSEW